MTEVNESTVKLRALVSAKDPAKLWDLRCALREHMIKYLRDTEHGKFLPRRRVEEGALEG
jgi:hypothetical protein